MDFFNHESNFKITIFFFFFLGGWGGGAGAKGGARVSGFFFTKNPNLKKKKKIFFFGGGGGGRGRGWGGIDGRTDEEAQTNLPLQLLRSWGHYNA